MRRGMALALFLFLALAALCGCEDKSVRIEFQQMEKAQVELGQVRKVALLDLDSYSREDYMARQATDSLFEMLREQKFLEIPDRAAIETTLHRHNLPVLKKPDQEMIRQYGRVLGVDAVLAGWIEARVDTERRYRTVYRYIGTGEYEDYQEREYVLFGPVVTKRREKTRQIEATEMYIRKEGMVVVEMTAYDTKSGGVLGKSTTRKTFAEDYPQSYYPSSVYFPDTYSSRIPSDDEILNALMHKALGNMVKAFSPHFLPRSRKLDKGASGEEAVRSGIRKAQGGDWNGALSVWSEFLKKNPGSYAAHKNIAIAYEVTQRYSEALTHYRQALALRPKANDVRSAISEVERVFVPPPPSPPKLFHIVEKRDDGALYIDAGARDGAAVDDIFELLEEKEIRSTQGEVIGKDHIVVGTLRVAKVFERMSLAVLAAADKPEAVKIGDFVRKK